MTDYVELGPTPTDPERLTLLEWVQTEAARYFAMDHAAGDLLGRTLTELARGIRATSARTVDQFEDRRDVIGV